jgi:hypothetical protein
MVMNCLPFGTADLSDPYYQRLVDKRGQYWQIFDRKCKPSEEFKDFVEKLLKRGGK